MISLLDAIARQEGFEVEGTRAKRNNNPGNLNYGPFARLHGATHGDDKGYAVFSSVDAGFAALRALLGTAAYRGHSLSDVIRRYCPPAGDPRGENDTADYIAHVAMWTGIKPGESIDKYVA